MSYLQRNWQGVNEENSGLVYSIFNASIISKIHYHHQEYTSKFHVQASIINILCAVTPVSRNDKYCDMTVRAVRNASD